MSLGDEHEASGGYGGTGQTRTRLPDTGADPYGTPRRRSSSRSLVRQGLCRRRLLDRRKAQRGRGRTRRTSTSPTPKFLQQYAVVFAASTILALLLWLLAVVKRAVRGAPP
ncbi:hypothetical protein SVIOM74S_04757 [Streptomyces violarus]